MKKALLLFLIVQLFFLPSFSQNSTVADTVRAKTLTEVVVTASKHEESLLKSPVSIEKLSLQDIKQSAQPGFFDAIQNLKGIQVITPSMGFKVINA
jgi:iron complex outermembrane receptor protein